MQPCGIPAPSSQNPCGSRFQRDPIVLAFFWRFGFAYADNAGRWVRIGRRRSQAGPLTTEGGDPSTNGDATADPGLAERKLFVTSKLAGQLVDQLERLERELDDDLPLDREQLRGQVDDIVMLAAVLQDELGELALP